MFSITGNISIAAGYLCKRYLKSVADIGLYVEFNLEKPYSQCCAGD